MQITKIISCLLIVYKTDACNLIQYQNSMTNWAHNSSRPVAPHHRCSVISPFAKAVLTPSYTSSVVVVVAVAKQTNAHRRKSFSRWCVTSQFYCHRLSHQPPSTHSSIHPSTPTVMFISQCLPRRSRTTQ